jgi:hypothetical protein
MASRFGGDSSKNISRNVPSTAGANDDLSNDALYNKDIFKTNFMANNRGNDSKLLTDSTWKNNGSGDKAPFNQFSVSQSLNFSSSVPKFKAALQEESK